MANVITKVERIEFIIKDDLTICNLLYSSSAPSDFLVGGGWKTKTFSAKKPVADFINEETANYLSWPSGREGIDE